jgi:serine protease Do
MENKEIKEETKELKKAKKNNHHLHGNKNIIVFITFIFIGALLMYGVIYMYPQALSTTKVVKDITVNENGIADAVEKVYDSVVVVSTYKGSTLAASGTGFVYKEDGDKAYILTNYHVIEAGNKVTVTFTNGKVVETTIVGHNQYSDIAVLSVNSKDVISVASIGSSKDARVGDTMFTVGAPLDSTYSWTVTRGILSGKDRMVQVSLSNSASGDYVMKVLQTDASINSGNSGGPLCNSNGEVIGITSLKLVSSGVEGMGFAIPIEDAVATATSIMNGEKTETPYIGISMVDLATAYYQQNYYDIIKNSNLTKGVFVVSVEKDSPADKAGLKDNDIITKINDTDISSMAYLRYELYQHKVGETITITYYRDGKTSTANVVLGTNKSAS